MKPKLTRSLTFISIHIEHRPKKNRKLMKGFGRTDFFLPTIPMMVMVTMIVMNTVTRTMIGRFSLTLSSTVSSALPK